jgi:hypothetical protein
LVIKLCVVGHVEEANKHNDYSTLFGGFLLTFIHGIQWGTYMSVCFNLILEGASGNIC